MIPNTGKIVVQFGAPWCGPCKGIRPIAEQLAKDKDAQFIYVDVDEHTSLANQMNVRSVPTVMAIQDGQELGRTGSAGVTQLRTIINNCFHS